MTDTWIEIFSLYLAEISGYSDVDTDTISCVTLSRLISPHFALIF